MTASDRSLLIVGDVAIGLIDNGDGTYSVMSSGGTGGGGDASAANQTTQIGHEAAIRTAVEAMDDWDESDRAKVNLIASQAGIDGGSGNVSAKTIRSVLATDVALPAGENHVGNVTGKSAVLDFTLSLDTSGAYASGDVLADTQALSNAMRVNDGTGVAYSLVLNDKDDQGQALDLYFLSANNSLGTENSAPSISDANADAILGFVSITTSDWQDLGGCRIAFIPASRLGIGLKAGSGVTTIWLAAICRSGTPTYTASGITGRLTILQD